MDGYHLFVVLRRRAFLLECLVRQPVLVLQEQVLEDGELTVDGCERHCILPLPVLFEKVELFAAHKQPHQEQAKIKTQVSHYFHDRE